jgi:MOSC domain-containing protein YiiM
MVALQSAAITADYGVANDLRGKFGRRQITVMSEESWNQACRQINALLPWTTRRANLLISGLDFSAKDRGKIISLDDVRLLITYEAKPCIRMDQAYPGLQAALTPNYRGGVCCQVLTEGKISIGASVNIQS